MRAWRGIPAALLIVGCVACGDDDDGGQSGGGGDGVVINDPIPDPGPGEPTTTQTPTGGGGGNSPSAGLVASLQTALSQFWSGQINGWQEPAGWTFYTDETASTLQSGCGSGADMIDNSFYCGTDRIVYMDWTLIDKLARSNLTNAGVVWLLSHEFGHHVNKVLGNRNTTEPVGNELSADCLSGVFTSALSEGGLPVTLEDGDVGSMLATVSSDRMADEGFGNSDWFTPQKHGGAAERTQALATGYITGDRSFCDAYINMTAPMETDDLGSGYKITVMPDSTTNALDDGGVLATSLMINNLHWEVHPVTGLTNGSALQVFDDVVNKAEGLTPSIYLEPPETFLEDTGWNGMSIGRVHYSQPPNTDGNSFHGVFLVLTAQDGTGVLLDTWMSNEAASSDPGWHQLEAAAFGQLYGMSH